MSKERLVLQRARLYQSVRTAHLERAHKLPPATIIFSVKRYDYDAALADGLSLVEASGLKAACLLFRSDVRELEINEPLMLSSLPSTAVALAALALRDAVRRRRTLVVAYAIGNTDPFLQAVGPRFRSRIRRAVERVVARLVWQRLDRVAYGTEAARSVYRSVLPPSRRLREQVVPALPPVCECGPPASPDGTAMQLVFLGALSERKGFPTLLEAWPSVVAALPEARLVVLGKGPLGDQARAAAAADHSVSFIEDPERATIHAELWRSSVAVLASRSSSTWREQVGLPIVEALGHGCRIVTTTETGLAEWLAGRGHTVVDPHYGSQELATALVAALASDHPDRAQVLATLPEQDGRLMADDYMFSAR